MRYYCRNCMAEFVLIETLEESAKYCPMCMRHLEKHPLVEIPDYETPEQYKERTGEKYSDESPVWIRKSTPRGRGEYVHLKWNITTKKKAMKMIYRDKVACVFALICVNSINPPPDDWELAEWK